MAINRSFQLLVVRILLLDRKKKEMKLSSAVLLGTAYGQLDLDDLERKSKREIYRKKLTGQFSQDTDIRLNSEKF